MVLLSIIIKFVKNVIILIILLLDFLQMSNFLLKLFILNRLGVCSIDYLMKL